MTFEHLLFIIPVGVGALFVLVGLVMIKFPAKTINGLYGYRTMNSMKSQERWEYAQVHSAREFIRGGFILALVSPLGIVNAVPPFAGMIMGLFLIIATAIILLIRTEKAIKVRFGNDEL